MIGVRLMGGLGNMMFQIAAGESWREMGYDVVYTDVDKNLDFISKNYTPKRMGQEYKHIFANFDWNKYKAPDNMFFKPNILPYGYIKMIPQEGVEYIGYFQSEKWFHSNSFMWNLFHPSATLFNMLLDGLRLLEDTTACSIHVRRQDYLKLSDYHTNLGLDYYVKAISEMEAIGVQKFLVFSDDLDWCRKNFIGNEFLFINEKDYICMYIMSYCNQNIIANSSLSWWGAYLGDTKDRIVIAPEQWFGVRGQDSKDVCPNNWIKL